ncbi:1,4-alpha-glucan branching enzyme [Sphaerisporangium corydalis]|uniref:1,4-alpha-glucan branching enzyme n=1 Tax=Sphaerisporangium corydalis TaxID=1441875 RepID=A0ABV9EJ42_9ACTN|nr:1,4-alpha-glucan branching enzyme [Sphaerisporangium corydalis]
MNFILRSEESLSGRPGFFPRRLGDSDLRRLGDGRHERLWQVLGAHTTALGTAFAVWAPNAREVRVVGDFNDWRGAGHAMTHRGVSGVWDLFVPGVGDGCRYKYEILGLDGQWRHKADPLAAACERPPATASIVFTSAHRWGDARWLTRRPGSPHKRPMSLYEVHLGSWRPGLGYRELAEELPRYVADLGFTHVELMPVAEWAADQHLSTAFYAPSARYGGPDDFRHLVDRLHQAGIGVVLDWTPRRFGPEEWGLTRFDGSSLYEGEEPSAFDHSRPEVRGFLLANAIFWCSEYHVDGLRVGGVASMLRGPGGDAFPAGAVLDDFGPFPVDGDPGAMAPPPDDSPGATLLREVNAAVARLHPGVVTVAEESGVWDGTAPLTAPGSLGFGLKWNTGWTHDCLGYLARDPVYRRYHHGEITFPMVYAYSEHHVLPVSHATGPLSRDMPGDRWRRRATVRAFLGFMWAHPGKQLLFMGQEFAQEEEWSPERGLRWDLADDEVRDLVRDLNSIYAGLPALWRLDSSPEGFRWIAPDAAEENVLAFLRYDPDGRPMACVCNFSPVVRRDFRIGLPFAGRWSEVLNTDALPYGGSGVGNLGGVEAVELPWHCCAASASMVLPPLATIWFRPAPPDRPAPAVPI